MSDGNIPPCFDHIHNVLSSLYQRLFLVSGGEYQALLDLLDCPAQDNPGLRDLFSRADPWDTP